LFVAETGVFQDVFKYAKTSLDYKSPNSDEVIAVSQNVFALSKVKP